MKRMLHAVLAIILITAISSLFMPASALAASAAEINLGSYRRPEAAVRQQSHGESHR